MKVLKSTLILGIIIILTAFNCKAQKNDSLSNTKDFILYANIGNVVLYGKAGLALSIRNLSHDFYIYSNFRYTNGLIPSRIYFSYGSYGIPSPNSNASLTGFDIGVQVRTRSPLFKKPYAKYISNLDNSTAFYTGAGLELSYGFVDRSNDIYSFGGNSNIWEPTVNGLVGWTLHAKKIYFDIHIALGFGVSIIHYEPNPNNTYLETFNVNPAIFKYEFGFSIGYKL